MVGRKPVCKRHTQVKSYTPETSSKTSSESIHDIDILVFDNVDEAQFQGVELAGLIPIQPTWSVYGNAALLRGEVLKIGGKAPDPKSRGKRARVENRR